jgi:hypothetical protein
MDMQQADASAVRDGEVTMKNILASLELPELAKLEQLDISFCGEETVQKYYPPRYTQSTWIGTKDAWIPLDLACAARNITCFIRHPELTLGETSS